MPIFNYKSKEMIVKIVYYGPGLGGKTTSLQILHEHTITERKGELFYLATEADQTIYFEMLPLVVGEIKGFKLRFQMYTVPGQVKYNKTRRAVLQGVDALVFVADSQRRRRQANIESFQNLIYNLDDGYNLHLEDLPLVYEYNKRDLSNILTIDELDTDINPRGLPFFETIATEGEGVMEAFEYVSSLAIDYLEERVELLSRGKSLKNERSKLSPEPPLPPPEEKVEEAANTFAEQDVELELSELDSYSEEEDTGDADIITLPEKKEALDFSIEDTRTEVYQDGERIFDEGDPGDKMYFIEKGNVKIIGHSTGKPTVLVTYEKGDFFGEIVLFAGSTRTAKAVAEGETCLVPITQHTLAEQLRQKPEITTALLKTLSNRIRGNTQTINKLVNQNQELLKHLKKAHDMLEHSVKQNKLLRQRLEGKK